MPKFRWVVIFEAEDVTDAEDQTTYALDSLHSVISEQLEPVVEEAKD